MPFLSVSLGLLSGTVPFPVQHMVPLSAFCSSHRSRLTFSRNTNFYCHCLQLGDGGRRTDVADRFVSTYMDMHANILSFGVGCFVLLLLQC